MKTLYKKQEEKNIFNKFLNSCKEEFEEESIVKSFPRMILKMFLKIDDEEIEESLRGLGSNDDGIDAFFVDDIKKEYFLIQFKSKKTYNEKENDLAKKEWFALLNQSKDHIINRSFKSSNKRIQEIKKYIEEDLFEYRQENYIYHLGSCSDIIKKNYDNITYIGQEDILNKFVQYYEEDIEETKKNDSLDIFIKDPNSGKFKSSYSFISFIPKALQGNVRKTMIFTLNGIQVIELLKNGTTIFDRNIRSFLGEKQEVNKYIIETAIKSPNEFYYYNNGIAITCDKFEANSLSNHEPKITLHNPQIINGAQTVSSILYAYNLLLKKNKKDFDENTALRKTESHFEDLLIICKVIESNKGTQTKLTQNITKYSNSQNKIKFSDFYANRDEQRKLQEVLKEFNIEYIIKRGVEKRGKKNLKSITMETLAEHHYAQNFCPFKSNISEIFGDSLSDNNDNYYLKIFNNKISYINENKISYVKSYHIYTETRNILKNIKKDYSYIEELKKNNNEEDIKLFLNNLEKNKNGFYYMTNSKAFVEDHLSNKIVKAKKNLILKYLEIIEIKALSYIVNQYIQNSYFKRREDEETIRIQDLINKNIKNDEVIKKILEKIIKESLNTYAKILNEMKNNSQEDNNSELLNKFRKTSKNIEDFKYRVESYINELEDESIIYDF